MANLVIIIPKEPLHTMLFDNEDCRPGTIENNSEETLEAKYIYPDSATLMLDSG